MIKDRLVSWRAATRLGGGALGAIIGLHLIPAFVEQVYMFNNYRQYDLVSATGLLIGLAYGFWIAPKLTIDLTKDISNHMNTLTLPELIGGAIGIVFGLMLGAGAIFMLSIAIGFTGGFLGIFFLSFVVVLGWRIGSQHPSIKLMPTGFMNARIILDSSILIDPRCLDILETGLGYGLLFVPQGAIDEIQALADSHYDPNAEQKGQMGLANLHKLEKIMQDKIRILEKESNTSQEVDEELLRLAKDMGGIIVTTDGILSKLANIAKLPVCNPNLLLKIIKQNWQEGDQMQVKIYDKGRRPHQGIAHTPDGAMIIIENGEPFIGQEKIVTITKVSATKTGVVLFAQCL